MVKKLTLIRHGEAETGIGSQGDFKRAITGNGIFKLQRLNHVLKQKQTSFDLLLKSPALRAMQTAQLISNNLIIDEEIIEDAIYDSSVDTLLELIQLVPNRFENVLLVGHNPGISALLVYLVDDFNLSLLPGMMAVLTFDLPDWRMLSRGTGNLVEVLL